MKSKSILKHSLTLLLTFQLAVVPKLFAQNIAINTTGNRPDTSAMLDVNSTTLGFLSPRMTTTQMNAIVLPATGLLIYNTSLNVFEVNIGTSSSPNWVPISTSLNGWSTTGNAGTNSNTNFLGTADNTSLYLRTNNQNRVKIDSVGFVGIGTTTPSQLLQIQNTGFAEALVTATGTNDAALSLSNTGTGGRQYTLYSTGSADANGAGNFGVYDNISSLYRVFVNSSGNVGIGTTTPAAQLHTTGTVRFAGLTATTGNTKLLTADASGNITTTTSSSILGAGTNTLTNTTNTITSTVNGVAASAPAVNTVGNTISGNTVLTTVNGVPGTAVTVPNIYTADGTLAANRTVTQGANTLAFTSTATNGFSVDGTTFSIDAANNRVGIGTTTPASQLSVSGTVFSGNNSVADISNTSAGSLIDALTVGINNCGGSCGQSTARNLVLYNGNTTNSNFLSMDFVPGSVSTGLSGASIQGIDRDATNGYAGFSFYTRNSTNYSSRMVIKSSGNVGIGTTAPSAQLHTTGTVRFAGLSASTGNTNVLTADAGGNITTTTASSILGTGTNTLTNTTNTITSTINGVAASAPAVNTVGNTISGNTVLTTVNGVPGTAVTVPNIYTADGTLAANRTVTQGANTLAFTSTAVNGFSVDGSTFSVDASNNRVGIGTATPGAVFQVNGTESRFSNSTSIWALAPTTGGTGSNALEIIDRVNSVRRMVFNDNGNTFIGGTLFDNSGTNSTVAITGSKVGIETTSPTSTLQVNGSFATNISTVSTTYTVLSTDYTVIFSGQTAAFTTTLPDPTTCKGRILDFCNYGTQATAANNTVTLSTPAGNIKYRGGTANTVSSATTFALSSGTSNSGAGVNGFSFIWKVMLQSDGTNWYVIANEP